MRKILFASIAAAGLAFLASGASAAPIYGAGPGSAKVQDGVAMTQQVYWGHRRRYHRHHHHHCWWRHGHRVCGW